MKQHQTCDRCGGIILTRADRRFHAKCPPTQMERVNLAMAFNDPEWRESVHAAAQAGNKLAQSLMRKEAEAKRDFALLQKMYNNEQSRMAKDGLKLDGTPLVDPSDDNATETTQNTNKESENGTEDAESK